MIESILSSLGVNQTIFIQAGIFVVCFVVVYFFFDLLFISGFVFFVYVFSSFFVFRLCAMY